MATNVQADASIVGMATPVLTWRRLLGGGAVVVLGSAISNALSFLFAFAIARLLRPEDYATVIAGLSILVVAAVPAVTLQLVAARYAAIWSHHHPRQLESLAIWLCRTALILGAVLALALGALSLPVAAYLHMPSRLPLLVVGGILFCSFLSPVYRGLLQGQHRFGRYAAATTSEYAVRLVLGFGFVAAGWRVEGALAGILAGAAISTVLGWWLTRTPMIRSGCSFPIGPVVRWAWPTLLVQAALNIMLYQDTLLAKHFFSPAEAGAYAGLATAARALVYLAGALGIFLFPVVARSQVTKGRGRLISHFTIGIVLTVEVVLLIIFMTIPDTVLRIVVGSQYASGSQYLPDLALALAAYALISILVTYLLAAGNRAFWLPLLTAPIAQSLLLAVYHSSLSTFVHALDAAMLATMTILLFIYLRSNAPIDESMTSG